MIHTKNEMNDWRKNDAIERTSKKVKNKKKKI